jgi:hypothetical protein
MSRLKISLFYLLVYGINLISCGDTQPKEEVVETPTNKISLEGLPKFNADSAYAYVQTQVAFGPRVPNSPGYIKCGDWYVSFLKKYADTVVVQKADLKAFDGKVLHSRNIIASFNPQNTERVMLSAHWDTRPFADQDEKDMNKPIDGANDGGSGVAVLLELARLMKEKKPNIGVDIVLWDSEDYGQPEGSSFPHMENSYCLGSQYWAKNPHKPGYTARWGILLDMCGAINATFGKEQISLQHASNLVNRVWENADALGYGSVFTNSDGGGITDDHFYINTIAHIPTIDIIHRTSATPSGFGPYWHTHNDNMSSIDKNVMRMVGETVLYTVFEEK